MCVWPKIKGRNYFPVSFVCDGYSFTCLYYPWSLPPASKGWGRYCFHRCVSVHRGCPSPRWGGLPQSWPGGTGVPLQPGQDWIPPARTGVPPWPGQDWGTPQPGQGYPLPQDRTVEWALPMRWAVYLLHSHRRTFLFHFNFLKKIGGYKSFLCGHSCPCFEILVMSALGFQSQGGSLAYMVSHLLWSSDSPLVQHLLTV